MAWISVHEDITGGKLRELSKHIGCSQNESIGILIRLWLWCINNADKYGRIIGANIDDIAEILNVGRNKEIEPEDIVKSLIECNWLEVIDGTLYVHDWEEWQEPLYTFKERKEKDRIRKRNERAAAKAARKATEEKETAVPTPAPEAKAVKQDITQSAEPVESAGKRSKTEYPVNFEEFWKAYPRHEGKGEAYKKYKARQKDGYSEEELITAAENYARRCAAEHTQVRYIKHAKTFLSDSMPFVDFLPKQRGGQDKQSGGYGGSSDDFLPTS